MHFGYAAEILQLENFKNKFITKFLPIYFTSLKKIMRFSLKVNNYRLLLALKMWQPRHCVLYRFLRSATTLMPRYESQ